MDLHQLYVFTKVVELKSFSRAADATYLSQSTVSTHIQSLEKTLKVKLFDRFGRDIVLTPQGERLYYWAKKLLLLKDQALLDINRSSTELKGIIQIGASSVPSQFIVPKMVKDFRKSYPHATFSILQFSSKIVAEKVQDGTVDLGVLGEKYDDDKLSYIPLQKDSLSLIASRNEFQIKEPVTIEDVIHYPFVMRNSNSGTKAMLDRFFRKNGIKEEQLEIVAYADNNQSIIELVKQGIGVSIISELAARAYSTSELLEVHNIKDLKDERYFYLVYNKKKTLSLIAKLFIKMVSSE